MSDINIICWWWNDWPDGNMKLGLEYVKRLQEGLQRFTTMDYKLICFTDKPVEVDLMGICTRDISHVTYLRWNFPKMYMYATEARLDGEWIVSIDLDAIIVGNMDEILTINSDYVLTSCAGAYRPNMIGGSITAWHRKNQAELETLLWHPLTQDHQRRELEIRRHGSERWHYRKTFTDGQVGFWEYLLPGQVASYKRDCQRQGAFPEHTRIVRFHGDPRPHEVDDTWVQEYWKALA